MTTAWILHLLVCISLNLPTSSIGNPLDAAGNTDLKYTDAYYPADADAFLGDTPDKRLSKFVRIGRGLSSFIRIGRAQPELYSYDDDDSVGDDRFDGDRSAFESTPGIELPEKRRLSSFVRIGRGGELGDDSDFSSNDFQKRGGAFIRMGKFPSSAMLRQRNGIIHTIARQPYYRRSGRIGQSSFIRIGKRDTSDALERMEKQHVDNPAGEYRRYLRIGKDLDGAESDTDDTYNNLDKRRLSSFVRIGRGRTVQPADLYRQYMELQNLKDKRMSKFVRIGKDGLNADKRMSKFVRIGKGDLVDSNGDMDKRMSKFVRIGKGNMLEDGDMDKRMSKFVRIGKGDLMDSTGDMDKRMSNFVRIGKGNMLDDGDMNKRMSKFVRIGKGGTMVDEGDMDKRMSKFVRIGKDIDHLQSDLNKRLSSFVRIGKSSETYGDIPEKRLSSFVRIGKSFDGSEDDEDKFVDFDDDKSVAADLVSGSDEELVDRIGSLEDLANDAGTDTPSNELDKRALSKFVRIGKSANDMNTGLADMDKRGRLSSFVRIGRSTDGNEQEAEVTSDADESK